MSGAVAEANSVGAGGRPRLGPGWLTVLAAAEHLGVTPGRVYHLITDNRVKYQMVNGQYMVSASSVRKYAKYQRELRTLGGARADNG